MQQFKFEKGQFDPNGGTFANSHKARVDEMKKWDLSLFHCSYKSKKNYYYVFLAKHNHNKFPCITEFGSAQTNKQCSNKMCKKGYVLTSLVEKSMQMQGPCQGGKENNDKALTTNKPVR